LQAAEHQLKLLHATLFRAFLVGVIAGQGFQVCLFTPDTLNEFRPRLLFYRLYLWPRENSTVNVSLRCEASRSLQHRTEAFAWLNAVASWVLNFSFEIYGCTDVVPARQLPNRQNIAVAKSGILT